MRRTHAIGALFGAAVLGFIGQMGIDFCTWTLPGAHQEYCVNYMGRVYDPHLRQFMPDSTTAFQDLRDGSFDRDIARYFHGRENQARTLAFEAWILSWLMNRGWLGLQTTVLVTVVVAGALCCQYRRDLHDQSKSAVTS